MVEFANWIQDPRYTTRHIAINARGARICGRTASAIQRRLPISSVSVGLVGGDRRQHELLSTSTDAVAQQRP
jgi:hypothetical protein